MSASSEFDNFLNISFFIAPKVDLYNENYELITGSFMNGNLRHEEFEIEILKNVEKSQKIYGFKGLKNNFEVFKLCIHCI